MALIREGIYKVQVKDAVWSPNSKNTGHYLKVTFAIQDHPEFENREVNEYFNFDNVNPRAEKAAHNKWVRFCTAGEIGPLTFDWKKGPHKEILQKIYKTELFLDIGHRPSEDGQFTFYEIRRFVPLSMSEKEHKDTPLPSSQESGRAHPVTKIDLSDLDDDIPF